MSSLSDRLRNGEFLRAPRAFADVLLADVSLKEAHLLAADGEPRRMIEEALALVRQQRSIDVRGLLILIRDVASGSAGFIEVLDGPDGFEWHGPFGPMGPLDAP